MNRLEWVLGILLALLLLIVAGLSLMFWFQPDAPVTAQTTGASTFIDFDEAAPTSAFEGATAVIAYVAAQQTAVSWQPDAVLLNTSGTWPHGVSPQTLDGGETSWSFTFYSPTAEKMSGISVIENEATRITEGPYQPQHALVHVSSWNIDSNEAMQIFLTEGGKSFIQQEGATTVTMNFTTDNSTEQIQWNIVSFSPKTGHLLSMQINANSGQITTLNAVP